MSLCYSRHLDHRDDCVLTISFRAQSIPFTPPEGNRVFCLWIKVWRRIWCQLSIMYFMFLSFVWQYFSLSPISNSSPRRFQGSNRSTLGNNTWKGNKFRWSWALLLCWLLHSAGCHMMSLGCLSIYARPFCFPTASDFFRLLCFSSGEAAGTMLWCRLTPQTFPLVSHGFQNGGRSQDTRNILCAG